MEKHVNLDRLREIFRKRKPRVLNPPPAAVTIVGFNVRPRNKSRSPNVKTRRSALRFNNKGSPPKTKRNYSNLSKNEIQRLINSGANNRNELENLWVKKTVNENSFHSIRKILDSGAIHSKKHYRALENAWLNKIIKHGTAHNLNQAMKNNGGRYSTVIANAWSLRRIPTRQLSSLVNKVPQTTRMGYNTAKALYNELERRHNK